MKKRSNSSLTLKLFWRFTRERKTSFWIGTIGAALAVIIQDIIPPVIVASAFDRLQESNSSGIPLELGSFKLYLYGYAACLIVGLILWRIQVVAVWHYEVHTVRNIAVLIFDHLQKMGNKFHADRFGGALVSQANKFMGAYERVMDEFTWSVTTGIVAYVTSMAVLLVVATWYALAFMIVSIFYLTIMYRRTVRTMKYDRALATSESLRTAKLADMITNVSAVSSFAGEKHEKKLFEKQADDTVRHYFTLLKKVFVNDTLSHVMTSSISFISFASGILAITVFNKPAGVLFLAVNYTMQLTRRLWESNRVLRNFNRAFGDANDMTEILQLKPDIVDSPNATELVARRGDITFNKVTFGYDDNQGTLLFNNLNMRIKSGEKVGLVGHSGGGKTSVTKLLLRFMDLNAGQIAVDGQNIAEVSQASLRSSIAYVPQEPMLFHRSLAENISYGRTNAAQQEIEAVAKMAHAHEFISQLPNGYETLVGERGVKLSGGQRQRVAIARAMLKNAPILVLDEATSALDSESEALIQDALWKLMEGRTAIVIAHRLSTIQRMDRILVMDDGKIAEEGTHKELIRQGGIYASLWSRQSGGFLED